MVNQQSRPEFAFLTGDLGFMALEDLRTSLGERFINAGVAEQNMVSVAAGMARVGLRPWVYSIAPFVYARPLEQIRNDVCLHNLPVTLVGNGGGYGYGVQGGTHHAIEDYGLLTCLQNIRCYIPAFDGDVPEMVARIFRQDSPAYLRLGLSEQTSDMTLPAYGAWRQLVKGRGSVVLLVVGPMVGGIWAAIRDVENCPNLWVLSELPSHEVPEEFLRQAAQAEHVIVVEEHVARGSTGEMLARELLLRGIHVRRFSHRTAMGYPSRLAGSQKFHRLECGLDAASVLALVRESSP